MEQIALYKDFRIRAYQDWSGQWLAEAKRPFDRNPEYIATPFPHPTAEAAVDLVKQLIDGEGTRPQPKPDNEDNSGEAMLAALKAEFRRTSSSPGSANDSIFQMLRLPNFASEPEPFFLANIALI